MAVAKAGRQEADGRRQTAGGSGYTVPVKIFSCVCFSFAFVWFRGSWVSGKPSERSTKPHESEQQIQKGITATFAAYCLLLTADCYRSFSVNRQCRVMFP